MEAASLPDLLENYRPKVTITSEHKTLTFCRKENYLKNDTISLSKNVSENFLSIILRKVS